MKIRNRKTRILQIKRKERRVREQELQGSHRYRHRFDSNEQEFVKRNVALRRHTRKLCNCWKCVNPRKVWKDPTIQEKIQLESMQDQLKNEE